MSSPSGRARERHNDAIATGARRNRAYVELELPKAVRPIGITGGSIFPGEILPDQMFGSRLVAGSLSYRSPVDGFSLFGSEARPGGAVFSAPDRNCARAVLADLDRARK